MKCHIITAPPVIINKIEKFDKSSEKLTLDTVRGFLDDSKKSNFKILKLLIIFSSLIIIFTNLCILVFGFHFKKSFCL